MLTKALSEEGDDPEPELVMHWHDPVTGAPGYIIIDAVQWLSAKE